MKIAVIVVCVVCVVCVDLTMAYPLRQSWLGLGRFSNGNYKELDDDQPTEDPVNAAATKSQQPRRPGSDAGEGVGWNGTPRDKRQFSDPSYWNSFRASDRHFDPIHLQNWSSQFGRSYRKFDGIQPGRRLRPVSGVYENSGDPLLHGGDSLQNWRALYSEDHF